MVSLLNSEWIQANCPVDGPEVALPAAHAHAVAEVGVVAGEVVAAELVEELDAGGGLVLEIDLFRRADVLLAVPLGRVENLLPDLLSRHVQTKEPGEGGVEGGPDVAVSHGSGGGEGEDVDIFGVDSGAPARAYAVDDEVALELELVVRARVDRAVGGRRLGLWTSRALGAGAGRALGEVLGVAELCVPCEGAERQAEWVVMLSTREMKKGTNPAYIQSSIALRRKASKWQRMCCVRGATSCCPPSSHCMVLLMHVF